jgi:sigma-B regulation protein RsbU (phosphoserine phosphatase)
MKPLSRTLQNRIEDISEFVPDQGIIVYTKKGIIRYTSPNIYTSCSFSSEQMVGKSIYKFLSPIIGNSKKDLKALITGNMRGKGTTSDAILLFNHETESDRFEYAIEVKNGVHIHLDVSTLDRNHLIAVIFMRSYPTTKIIGRLSQDIMVRTNRKGIILGASDGFSALANVRIKEIFNKPLSYFFKSDSFKQAQKKMDRARYKLVSLTDSNPNAWQSVLQEDFFKKGWKKPWIIDRNFRFKKHADGIIVKGTYNTTYFIYGRIIDQGKYDLRWELNVKNQQKVGIAFCFNGWKCNNSEITTPDIEGYLIGYKQFGQGDKNTVRLKRWGKILMESKLPYVPRGKYIKLTGEKSGGVFRIMVDGKKVMECIDTQYLNFGLHQYTGFIISTSPLVLQAVKLWRRPSQDYARYTTLNFDVSFRSHPKQIFEAQFYERHLGKEVIHDIFLRRVTELRKSQRAIMRLLKQKEEALNQINDELKMAASVLNNLLPSEFPKIKGLNFHAYYHPSGHVGGDLFDVFPVDKNNLAVLMYDVSGHGVPAALISVMTKTIFQKHFNPGTSLRKQLSQMNNDLFRNIPGINYVTLFCGLLDYKKRTLRYIGAGFVPPLIFKKKSVMALHTKGIPLGIKSRISSREHMIQLRQNSKLILFTDGFYEVFNRKGEFYTKERPFNLLKKYGQLPVKSLINKMVEDHGDFIGSTPQQDDVSLLGIELK